jgi:Protein of unknown function (DUF2490)
MRKSNRERAPIRCASPVRQRAAWLLCGQVAIAAYAAAPLTAGASQGEPDDQLWTELDVTAPLTTNTTITGIGQLRLSETLPNPTLTALGLDLNYKVGNWTISPGYRHQVTGDREGDDIKISQVALLMATYARSFGRNTLAFRVRYEDTLHASSNPHRLRLRAEYRWAVEELSWVSYLYTNDEVFYEAQDNNWFRNRFQAGANLKLTKRTSLKVYYQRQDSNNAHPGAINALGLLAAVTFK